MQGCTIPPIPTCTRSPIRTRSRPNRLGEAVSIGVMQDMKPAYNEPYSGYVLTLLDGTTLRV